MNAIEITYNDMMTGLMARYNIELLGHKRCRLPKAVQNLVNGGISLREIDGSKYLAFNTNNNFELFYPDIVGNEFSNNKVYLESKLGMGRSLLMALTLAQEIIKQLFLSKISGIIIVSADIDNDECTCSFHQKRYGESWLQDNLDNYNSEGILKIVTENPK